MKPKMIFVEDPGRNVKVAYQDVQEVLNGFDCDRISDTEIYKIKRNYPKLRDLLYLYQLVITGNRESLHFISKTRDKFNQKFKTLYIPHGPDPESRRSGEWTEYMEDFKITTSQSVLDDLKMVGFAPTIKGYPCGYMITNSEMENYEVNPKEVLVYFSWDRNFFAKSVNKYIERLSNHFETVYVSPHILYEKDRTYNLPKIDNVFRVTDGLDFRSKLVRCGHFVSDYSGSVFCAHANPKVRTYAIPPLYTRSGSGLLFNELIEIGCYIFEDIDILLDKITLIKDPLLPKRKWLLEYLYGSKEVRTIPYKIRFKLAMENIINNYL